MVFYFCIIVFGIRKNRRKTTKKGYETTEEDVKSVKNHKFLCTPKVPKYLQMSLNSRIPNSERGKEGLSGARKIRSP
jgi:hypothetical protein